MKYIRRVLACLRKADERYGLIDNGDRIMVGVSGGKDSLVLLKALSIYGKFRNKRFKIVPCTLDLGFPGFDSSKISEFVSSLGLELIVEDSKEVYPILLDNTTPGKHIPCSICSRMKKAAINAAANKYGCNKVAFAHHQDDAIETLFMNMIHGARIATFEPKMHLERANITFIRPLIETSEADIAGMANEEELPVMGKICPADGITEREVIKQSLQKLYASRAEAHESFAEMLSNYEPFMVYFDGLELNNGNMGPYTLKPLLKAEDAIKYQTLAKRKGFGPLKENEKHFIVNKKHKMAGIISYIEDNPHQITITDFSLDEEETLKGKVLTHFIDLCIHKINPITFIYKGNEKAFAKRYGFTLGALPTNKKALAKRVTNASKR